MKKHNKIFGAFFLQHTTQHFKTETENQQPTTLTSDSARCNEQVVIFIRNMQFICMSSGTVLEH